MVACLLSCCVLIWTLGSLSAQNYKLHERLSSFDAALTACSPGNLTTIATQQETDDIISLISRSLSPSQTQFTLWVGLRRVKYQCVLPSLPLRGFKWTDGSGAESQPVPWSEEPKETCTTVRCAALTGLATGGAVTHWGLIPVTCKSNYGFICKLPPGTNEGETQAGTNEGETQAGTNEGETQAGTNEEERPTGRVDEEQTKIEPTIDIYRTPTPEPKTEEPMLETKSDEQPKTEAPMLAPGAPEEPKPTPSPCAPPSVPRSRSLTPHPDDITRLTVECWPEDQLLLRCSGRPAVWRLLDDRAADLTTLCDPCDAGFTKNGSARCVDQNECEGPTAPCRSVCVNTVGSYRCVCTDSDGIEHAAASPACTEQETDTHTNLLSGILFPVLVAVAALIVLAVIVAVTVKCCLIKKKKKKVEKMAMTDSYETDQKAAA